MARADRYAIIDEPTPGVLAQLSVSPLFPLLGFMLAGAWVGWLWFVFNAHAFGSATRWRETLVALLAPAATLLLLAGLGTLVTEGLVGTTTARYLGVLEVMFKLAVAYWLFAEQQRSFQLYEYFGGRRRNGMLPLMAAVYLGHKLVAGLPPAIVGGLS